MSQPLQSSAARVTHHHSSPGSCTNLHLPTLSPQAWCTACTRGGDGAWIEPQCTDGLDCLRCDRLGSVRLLRRA